MDTIDATEFEIEELGTSYLLPQYTVTKNGLKRTKFNRTIKFVRGSKDPSDEVEKQDGILHEALLAMQIKDLQYKDKLVESPENKVVIRKLKEALDLLRYRQKRRKEEGTQGTYQE
jgi:hypothetical protein